MYVLESSGRNTICYMTFFDRFTDPYQYANAVPTGKKLDIQLSRVETPDSKNYWLMAATYSSVEFAEAEAKRISDTIKERNPEKYPDGIKFRVMELWRIMDADKIRSQLQIHKPEQQVKEIGQLPSAKKESQLENGYVPANAACPFKDKCQLTCPKKEVTDRKYSCGAARGFDIVETYKAK